MYYSDYEDDCENDLTDLLSSIEIDDDLDDCIDFEPGEFTILYQNNTPQAALTGC